MVFGGPARSTVDLLYGDGMLAPEIEDASGERCYTTRAQRMREGCAIIYGVGPAADGYGIVVVIDE
jgi:hypothetical protein